MRKSFRDGITGVLKGHGYVSTNEPGDIFQDEPDNFDLEPGRWRWDGAAWIVFVAPPAPPSELKAALDDLKDDLAVNIPPKLRRIIRAWAERER
jgi:hypothetical protein